MTDWVSEILKQNPAAEKALVAINRNLNPLGKADLRSIGEQFFSGPVKALLVIAQIKKLSVFNFYGLK